MKTLKKGLNQENIDSKIVRTILTDYSKRDCVRIALYCAEDCFGFNPTKEARTCIELVKKWLEDEKSVTKAQLHVAGNDSWNSNFVCSNAAVSAAYQFTYNASYHTATAANFAAVDFGDEQNQKLEEYRNYARFFAYEDSDFPHRDFAKTFNLDNPTDLNILLDFLTDNYPNAITYDREEYFTNKLAKEYLKILYQ